MSKKSSIIIAAIVTLFSFVTITWLSCTKPANGPSCSGVVCENAGYCVLDTVNKNGTKVLTPQCACPAGYEGPTCATASVAKYLGTWDITEHVTWSTQPLDNGKDTVYEVLLAKTATNTTFFMNNFFNNANYNDIICDIDSMNTSNFTIDTLSDFHELYAHYQVKWGVGSISGNTINASMFIRFLDATTNWQEDSVTLVLTPHQF